MLVNTTDSTDSRRDFCLQPHPLLSLLLGLSLLLCCIVKGKKAIEKEERSVARGKRGVHVWLRACADKLTLPGAAMELSRLVHSLQLTVG